MPGTDDLQYLPTAQPHETPVTGGRQWHDAPASMPAHASPADVGNIDALWSTSRMGSLPVVDGNLDKGEVLVVYGHLNTPAMGDKVDATTSVTEKSVGLLGVVVTGNTFVVRLYPTRKGDFSVGLVINGHPIPPFSLHVRSEPPQYQEDDDRPVSVDGAVDRLVDQVSAIYDRRILALNALQEQLAVDQAQETSLLESVIFAAVEIALTVATDGLLTVAVGAAVNALKVGVKEEFTRSLIRSAISTPANKARTAGFKKLKEPSTSPATDRKAPSSTQDPPDNSPKLSWAIAFFEAQKGALIEARPDAKSRARSTAQNQAGDFEEREAGSGYRALIEFEKGFSAAATSAKNVQFAATLQEYSTLIASAHTGVRLHIGDFTHPTGGVDLTPKEEGIRDPVLAFDDTPGVLRLDLRRWPRWTIAESFITGFKNDRVVANFAGKTVGELKMPVVARLDSNESSSDPHRHQDRAFMIGKNEQNEFFGKCFADWKISAFPDNPSDEEVARRIFQQIDNQRVTPKRTG